MRHPRPLRGSIVALTGTPGTGKSAVARVLESRGWPVVALDRLLRSDRHFLPRDRTRRTRVVDLGKVGRDLGRLLPPHGGPVILVSHLAHLLPVRESFVLRCRPGVLGTRLRRRGWSKAKVTENVAAEALDVILWEAVARLGKAHVGEAGTNGRRPEEVASDMEAFLTGERTRFAPGRFDWSEGFLRAGRR